MLIKKIIVREYDSEANLVSERIEEYYGEQAPVANTPGYNTYTSPEPSKYKLG